MKAIGSLIDMRATEMSEMILCGFTGILYAAYYGASDVVQLLFEDYMVQSTECDITLPLEDDLFGLPEITLASHSSILMTAIAGGRFEDALRMLEWLNKDGGPRHQRDDGTLHAGTRPSLLRSMSGSLRCQLLGHQNSRGVSALMLLCLATHPSCLHLLQAYDLVLLRHELVLVDSEGKSCLFYAVDAGSYTTLDAIVRSLFDFRSKDLLMKQRAAKTLLLSTKHGDTILAYTLGLQAKYRPEPAPATGSSGTLKHPVPVSLGFVDHSESSDGASGREARHAEAERIYALLHAYVCKAIDWGLGEYKEQCRTNVSVILDREFMKILLKWKVDIAEYRKPELSANEPSALHDLPLHPGAAGAAGPASDADAAGVQSHARILSCGSLPNSYLLPSPLDAKRRSTGVAKSGPSSDHGSAQDPDHEAPLGPSDPSGLSGEAAASLSADLRPDDTYYIDTAAATPKFMGMGTAASKSYLLRSCSPGHASVGLRPTAVPQTVGAIDSMLATDGRACKSEKLRVSSRAPGGENPPPPADPVASKASPKSKLRKSRTAALSPKPLRRKKKHAYSLFLMDEPGVGDELQRLHLDSADAGASGSAGTGSAGTSSSPSGAPSGSTSGRPCSDKLTPEWFYISDLPLSQNDANLAMHHLQAQLFDTALLPEMPRTGKESVLLVRPPARDPEDHRRIRSAFSPRARKSKGEQPAQASKLISPASSRTHRDGDAARNSAPLSKVPFAARSRMLSGSSAVLHASLPVLTANGLSAAPGGESELAKRASGTLYLHPGEHSSESADGCESSSYPDISTTPSVSNSHGELPGERRAGHLLDLPRDNLSQELDTPIGSFIHNVVTDTKADHRGYVHAESLFQMDPPVSLVAPGSSEVADGTPIAANSEKSARPHLLNDTFSLSTPGSGNLGTKDDSALPSPTLPEGTRFASASPNADNVASAPSADGNEYHPSESLVEYPTFRHIPQFAFPDDQEHDNFSPTAYPIPTFSDPIVSRSVYADSLVEQAHMSSLGSDDQLTQDLSRSIIHDSSQAFKAGEDAQSYSQQSELVDMEINLPVPSSLLLMMRDDDLQRPSIPNDQPPHYPISSQAAHDPLDAYVPDGGPNTDRLTQSPHTATTEVFNSQLTRDLQLGRVDSTPNINNDEAKLRLPLDPQSKTDALGTAGHSIFSGRVDVASCPTDLSGNSDDDSVDMNDIAIQSVIFNEPLGLASSASSHPGGAAVRTGSMVHTVDIGSIVHNSSTCSHVNHDPLSLHESHKSGTVD